MDTMRTQLDGVILIKPKLYGDTRGYFLELYQEKRYEEAGITAHFVQDNFVHSHKGALRGLHFQTKNLQDKLVMVTHGSIFDVAVDLRKNSPTFGQYYSVILSAKNHWQLFIPKGFAHGFYVLEDRTDVYYKCSDYRCPEFESGIIWNDPDLKIDWPLDPLISPIILPRDTKQLHLRDLI